MLSKQELMSYVRNSYNEYKENDAEFNNEIDSIIERRWTNARNNNKIRANGHNANISRELY